MITDMFIIAILFLRCLESSFNRDDIDHTFQNKVFLKHLDLLLDLKQFLMFYILHKKWALTRTGGNIGASKQYEIFT